MSTLRTRVSRFLTTLVRPWRVRADARADRRLAQLRADVRAQYPTHADFVILGGPGCDLAAAWYGRGVTGERAFRAAWRAVQAKAAWRRDLEARITALQAQEAARVAREASDAPALAARVRAVTEEISRW